MHGWRLLPEPALVGVYLIAKRTKIQRLHAGGASTITYIEHHMLSLYLEVWRDQKHFEFTSATRAHPEFTDYTLRSMLI